MDQVNATSRFLGEESQWTAASIELYDVQGLWGGRRILIEGTGRIVVQRVEPSMQESRYELAASDDVFQKLLGLFIEVDFLTVKPPERAGIPDERRPSLTLTNAKGEKRTVSKWPGLKDPHFDKLYDAIVRLESLTQDLAPVYQGPYRREV